jgi:NAD(P)H-dependent FMN reductase
MPEPTRVLAFAGSLRSDSWNKKLARVAARSAEAAGAEATFVDLRDYALPVYDGDLEAESGLPDGAVRLKEAMKAADAFLISSPEYNGSLSAALKNAIDWASRPAEGEASLECFAGKVAGIMAASPGGLGGLRGLFHLRTILSGIRVLVIPEQRALSQAHQSFDDGGNLVDEKVREQVDAIGRRVVEVAGRLKT